MCFVIELFANLAAVVAQEIHGLPNFRNRVGGCFSCFANQQGHQSGHLRFQQVSRLVENSCTLHWCALRPRRSTKCRCVQGELEGFGCRVSNRSHDVFIAGWICDWLSVTRRRVDRQHRPDVERIFDGIPERAL